MREAKEKIASTVATFFYVGHIPKMPGTWGSLAALPFVWYLHLLPFYLSILVFIFATVLGIWAASSYCTSTNQHDNQKIVIDEVLGMAVATFFTKHGYLEYALAFFLFRLFDIFKPFPIRLVDTHVKGGLGVVLDDLLAGLYVAVLFLLYTLFPFSLKGILHG